MTYQAGDQVRNTTTQEVFTILGATNWDGYAANRVSHQWELVRHPVTHKLLWLPAHNQAFYTKLTKETV